MANDRFLGVVTNPAFIKDVVAFLELSDDRAAEFFDFVDAGPPSIEALKDLGVEMNLPAMDAGRLSAVAKILRDAVRDDSLDPDQVVDGLLLVADEAQQDLVNSRSEFLKSAIRETPAELAAGLRDRAAQSFVPVLRDFEATWDIRTVTDDEGQVVDYLPMLVATITAETDYKFIEVAFQMSGERFEAFKESVERLDGNYEAVKECCEALRVRCSEHVLTHEVG